MKKYLLFMIVSIPFFTTAQDMNVYQEKYFVVGKDSLPYRLLLPVNYDASKKYPLVLFLHGAGERGNDNKAQLVHGGKLFADAANRTAFPAIVIFPQCPKESFWSNVKITAKDGKGQFEFTTGGEPTWAMKMAQALLHQALQDLPVDTKKVYVGGLSMGGMGTFELVRREPGVFAAAISICGGDNPASAKEMIATKWWVFHGQKDDVVPPMHSEIMAEALKNAGADVKLTLYPDANHNSWDSAFAEPELLPWLFAQSK